MKRFQRKVRIFVTQLATGGKQVKIDRDANTYENSGMIHSENYLPGHEGIMEEVQRFLLLFLHHQEKQSFVVRVRCVNQIMFTR